jgi:hypothetical protein
MCKSSNRLFTQPVLRGEGRGEGLSPRIQLMESHPSPGSRLRCDPTSLRKRGELRKQARRAKLYTGNPACFANSFSETCGRAPMCWIASAAASAPSRPAFS